MKIRFIVPVVAASFVISLAGCGASADENPITPEKMAEMSKQRAKPPEGGTTGDRGPAAAGPR